MMDMLAEEYRQVYTLAVFRLGALDQRVPIAGALITALLGSVAAAPAAVQMILLVALPLSTVWLLRTTIRHAEAFHDAIARIAELEEQVNIIVGHRAMGFQSSHPSRGRAVGGRTGEETVETVIAASAVLLGSCLFLSAMIAEWHFWAPIYALFLAAIATWLIALRIRVWQYRCLTRSRGL